MGFLKGQRVKHSNKPDWGVGEVLDNYSGERVRVFFERGGERTLIADKAQLNLVEGDDAQSITLDNLGELPHIDVEKLNRLCNLFYSEMKDNRPNCNDGKLAVNIVHDLKRLHKLTDSTRKQLAAWCHTNGALYQRGVSIAQQISIAIYGRVIPPE